MSTTVSARRACSVGGSRCTGLAHPEGDRLVGEHASSAPSLAGRVEPARQVDGDDAASSATASTRPRPPAGRPGRPPMPRMPSSTRSASAQLTARGSAVRRRATRRPRPRPPRPPRAPRVRAVRPHGAQHRDAGDAGLGEARRRHTGRRRRCCRPDERDDACAPSRSSSRAATTSASPRGRARHQLALGQLGHGGRLGGPDAARRRRPRSRDHSALGDDDGRRDAGVVGQGDVQASRTPRSSARACTVPRDLQVRAAVRRRARTRGVGPVQPDRRAERLGQRLLGGEPGREGVERQVALLVGEQPLAQRRACARGSARSARRRRRRCRPRRSRGAPGSLDRDRLGQVARLVDVEALGRRQLAGRRPAAARRSAAARAAAASRARGSPRRRTARRPSSPSSAITRVRAPRARISWMLETTLPCRPCSLRRATGTMTKTGWPGSMSAIGPCLSSPAAKPSAWM